MIMRTVRVRRFTEIACAALCLLAAFALRVDAQAPPAAPAGPPAPLTGVWNVDPMHTNVNFAIKHFGISLVRGRFDDIAGTVVADATHPEASSVQFTIQTQSIDTNVKMRDDDLRSAHYFDAATFPTITYSSTSVSKTHHGYIAHGNLTIHGVTKPVDLPFELNGPIRDPFGASRIGATTELHLNRLDFGVGPTDTMGIGDDVYITISVEAIPAGTKAM